jgi:hypothetical protein
VVEKVTNLLLSEIDVPKPFMKALPKEEKIQAAKERIQKEGMKKPLVVHPKTKVLVDGFIRYLAAKELGFKEVPVQWGTKKRPKKQAKRKVKPSRPRTPYITEETLLSIWEAEDGRCEVCKRPMDRRLARWLPVEKDKIENHPDALHLVCVDCHRHQPEFLRTFIRVDKQIMKKIRQKTPYDDEQQFIHDFREYAVFTGKSEEKKFRQYWLPGIGSFFVKTLDEKENGLPVRLIYRVKRIYKDAELVIKEQQKSRGLKPPVL